MISIQSGYLYAINVGLTSPKLVDTNTEAHEKLIEGNQVEVS